MCWCAVKKLLTHSLSFGHFFRKKIAVGGFSFGHSIFSWIWKFALTRCAWYWQMWWHWGWSPDGPVHAWKTVIRSDCLARPRLRGVCVTKYNSTRLVYLYILHFQQISLDLHLVLAEMLAVSNQSFSIFNVSTNQPSLTRPSSLTCLLHFA